MHVKGEKWGGRNCHGFQEASGAETCRKPAASVSFDKNKEGSNSVLNMILEFNYKTCFIPCLLPLVNFHPKLTLLLLSLPGEKLVFLRALAVDTAGLRLKTNLM